MKCAICNKDYKAITGKHLKTHGITVSEYKAQCGDVVTEEYKRLASERASGANNPNYGTRHDVATRALMSEKRKGKQAHNKGVAMSDQQKAVLSDLAKRRHEKWHEEGTHPHVGASRSNETKMKISDARKKQVITPESIQKAIATKKERGYDMAFFRGKKHTAESKKKIAESTILHNKVRSEQALSATTTRLSENGYDLIQVDGKLFTLQCQDCGTEFTRTRQYSTPSKISDHMCPTCHPPIYVSNIENEIFDFVKQHAPDATQSVRHIIPPQELDIFIRSKNLAIEVDGLYWHSEIFKDKDYHINKTQSAEKQGLRLIHIFEDEWINNSEVAKSRILNALGLAQERIYARKCSVTRIESSVCNKFLNENHVQGSGRANVHYGLFNDSELVGVMTFLNGDISKNVSGWELNRFCGKNGTSIIGGASKIFSAFVREFNPCIITTFADRRWSSLSPFYSKLGFNKIHDSSPNYWYVMLGETKRIHRYALRKPENCSITERALRESEGYLRIYDCGSTKFVWESQGAISGS